MDQLPQYQKAPHCQGEDERLFGAFGTGFRTLDKKTPPLGGESSSACPKCQNNIFPTDFFCSVCGYKLKEKPLSTSFFKQLSIYLISFLLPPLGLIPAIKYIRRDERKFKLIGIIAVILTLASVILSAGLLLSFMDTLSKTLNGQLDTYENLAL